MRLHRNGDSVLAEGVRPTHQVIAKPRKDGIIARRMAKRDFRNEQWAHRYDPHIAPINRLVDELRLAPDKGWAPYVAPMYGGVNARLLSVLRDPGPATLAEEGSGFLCMENDDPTAETMSGLFEHAGIDATEIVPWNAYPWYINRAPNSRELRAGVAPLRTLIDLMPRLKVIMLHGGSALSGWKRLSREHPGLVATRSLKVISTYHTSRQAFWHADPNVRAYRKRHLRDAFLQAATELAS
jgi:hypothetical protein